VDLQRSDSTTPQASDGKTLAKRPGHERMTSMLYTLAVVLLILWLLGLVTATTMGGFIHVLLVIALVVVLLRVISGRKPF
jgi:predicted lipid-binding transport protein (Tim44 family)